jgi:hypothetical protein
MRTASESHPTTFRQVAAQDLPLLRVLFGPLISLSEWSRGIRTRLLRHVQGFRER